MSRDDPPDLLSEDPEESLRQLLRENAANDSEVPRAKHKRYAKRAMRRRKESARLIEARSARRDDTPVAPFRTPMTSKVNAIPVAPHDALVSGHEQADAQLARLRSDRRRLQEVIHKLRKEASDAKRELRFLRTEMHALSEREEALARENQRLRRTLLRSQPVDDEVRDRRFSGVSKRNHAEEDERTGTE